MKTETTQILEQLLRSRFDPRKDFYIFECTIGWYGDERVDCITYDTQRDISCYEIKQSKADFHSKHKLTFIGNKNYFVMPYKLYEEVKDEIPDGIGVYVAIDRIDIIKTRTVTGTTYSPTPIDGLKSLYCIKATKKRDLKADKEVILSSMLRSMQRDRVVPNTAEMWEARNTANANAEIANHIVELLKEHKDDIAVGIAKAEEELKKCFTYLNHTLPQNIPNLVQPIEIPDGFFSK